MRPLSHQQANVIGAVLFIIPNAAENKCLLLIWRVSVESSQVGFITDLTGDVWRVFADTRALSQTLPCCWVAHVCVHFSSATSSSTRTFWLSLASALAPRGSGSSSGPELETDRQTETRCTSVIHRQEMNAPELQSWCPLCIFTAQKNNRIMCSWCKMFMWSSSFFCKHEYWRRSYLLGFGCFEVNESLNDLTACVWCSSCTALRPNIHLFLINCL